MTYEEEVEIEKQIQFYQTLYDNKVKQGATSNELKSIANIIAGLKDKINASKSYVEEVAQGVEPTIQTPTTVIPTRLIEQQETEKTNRAWLTALISGGLLALL